LDAKSPHARFIHRSYREPEITMTDDSNARYRSSDPFSSRPANPDGQASDPLAELARLIGQTEAARESRPSAPQVDPAPPSDPAYAERSYEQRYDAPYANDPPPAADWQSAPASSHDPFAAGHQVRSTVAPADHSYHDEPSQPRALQSDLSFAPAHAHFAAAQLHQSDFAAPPLDTARRPGHDFPPPPRPSEHAVFSPPHADEFYDDAPQGGRRKGLLTVAAVLCLAVIGTAGAFGYRTWMGAPSAKSPPPVIKASADPKKVAPPPQADSSANKISYDRFGDRGQNERVVVREEKPVEIKPNGPPRAAVPNATNPAPSASVAAAPTVGNPPSVLTEPKRVRTVPIRPDTPDTSMARPQMTSPPPAQRPATVAAASSSNGPLNLANPVAPPQVRASAPPPPPQVRAPRQAPASSANAPLSLAPDSNPPPTTATPARSAPARVASAPSGNGSYLVQVSSQRSEADAQAAFRNIQSKYSSVLGDRQPVIRRAELAGRGTYYRAMVGPFSTRDQAIQLCSSLKAAGGDCVVQAN
jgi:hypothetical protein